MLSLLVDPAPGALGGATGGHASHDRWVLAVGIIVLTVIIAAVLARVFSGGRGTADGAGRRA